MKIGLIELIPSKKFWFCTLIGAPSTVALFMRLLDGPSYAAIVGTLASVFMWTHHKTEMAAMQMNSQLPPRGQV